MEVIPEFVGSLKELPSGKKIYFASDFHLGAPNNDESLKREKKIIKWLEHISNDAAAIFLLGDIFDFWFEYATTIPKGFIRFQGALAKLREKGIPIIIFSGNHDLWMKDYFPKELDIPVIRKPISIQVNDKKLLIGHGDGLGPGDTFYKLVKVIFTNPICQWFFRWLHPDIGVKLAKYWSKKSSIDSADEKFEGENERLWKYCKEVNQQTHHDFYVFGHRHLPLELSVGDNSTYYNLGEWVTQCNYLEFDGEYANLKTYNL